MSVTTIADVGGTTITLNVNGARLTMTLRTAYEVCHQLAHQLDALAMDEAERRMKEKIDKEYRHAHH